LRKKKREISPKFPCELDFAFSPLRRGGDVVQIDQAFTPARRWTEEIMSEQNEKKVASVEEVAEHLYRAVALLANCCDGAQSLDGQGFNKFDAKWGNQLFVEGPYDWDASKCAKVRTMLTKYQKQLAGMDFLLSAVPEVDLSAERVIGFEPVRGGQFVMRWSYRDPDFAELVEAVKDLEKRKWAARERVWVVPTSLRREVAQLAGQFGFSVDGMAEEEMRLKKKKPSPSVTKKIGVLYVDVSRVAIRFARYEPELLRQFKETFDDRDWDPQAKLWVVGLNGQHYRTGEDRRALVLPFARKVGLQVANRVREMLSRRTPAAPVAVEEAGPAPSKDDGQKEEDWSAGGAIELFS
jgi:hypothetical protein